MWVLIVVVVLAVGLRVGAGVVMSPTEGWGIMHATHLDLAVNIAAGKGYVTTLTGSASEQISLKSDQRPTFEQLDRDATDPQRPIQYYLPAYAYVIAPLVIVAERANNSWSLISTVRVFNALWDGVLGPVLVYWILAVFVSRRAGIFAAFLYAVHHPLIVMTTWPLPDALIPVITLAAILSLVLAFRYSKEFVGVAAAGMFLGVGSYFRGEMLAIVPFFALATFFASYRHFNLPQRISLAALVAVAWIVTTVPLAFMYHQSYGDYSWSRPGLGILMWEGIGQHSNEWGIEASDPAAQALLEEQGLQYGTPQGDRFLLSQSLEHYIESPGFLLKAAFFGEAQAIIKSSAVLTGPVVNYGEIGPVLNYGSRFVYLIMAVAGASIMFRRHRILALILIATWVSIALPFSLLRSNEWRFLLPMVITTLIFAAYFIDWIIQTLARTKSRVLSSLEE